MPAFQITDLWGIAGRLAKRLVEVGIRTPLQLRDADPQIIRERFNVMLERMVLELRGVPCIDLERFRPDNKSIMASRSFGWPVTTRHELEAVASYVSRAAEKLRRQDLAAGSLVVFVNTNQPRPQDARYNGTRPSGF